jgi:CheY-like chemotaxis protein
MPGERRRTIAATTDLFFQGKIDAVARQKGVPVTFASSLEEVEREVRADDVKLLIVDLEASSFEPMAAIAAARARGTVRTLGFLNHVYEELRRQALEAGCEEVLNKGVFAKRLPEILGGLTDGGGVQDPLSPGRSH